MRSSIGFDDRDAAHVRSLASLATPAIPALVDRFYQQLMQQERTRAIFTGRERQIQQLRDTLTPWLREVFHRVDEKTYHEKRRRIASAHVRAGVPQYCLVAGMELIYQELDRRARDAGIPDAAEKLQSLRKLLAIELAVMLEGYKESYSEQVRKVERSAVQEKLTRAKHLAEIGQLAASLAHEIKNPLAGISGAIQIIRDAMASDDPHQPIVTEMLGQIGRLDATVKDLLQYARPTPPRAAWVALDEVVTRVLTVMQEEPSLQRVRIAYGRALTDTTVYADDAQIEQLLMNLILNAAHASDDGGVIDLSIASNGNHVRLIVKDQGKGMASEVRERAFEPFFTTKAKGTGLGLTICRRIAEVHGGDIELESGLRKGTTVTVTLPYSSTDKDPTARR
ncbi:MAG: hypothetical protein JSU86_11715 [Phycisphaerales bacterium]|nr:MAG: hypothetical protein JSU86_11715 [Phycisphaerales bacterium]